MAKKITFEKKLEELENIVKSLESGEATLDESLKNFGAGVELYKDCKKYLDEVESKVSQLTKDLEEKELE
ncbi:MAG: exodeoxyribonuclease VII small subunit [Halobacteriovorax sp.]|nr:exodeoxyribonuclease VII small subunit [Halobacteriovorax sp.]MEE3079710.1 exodeoxyribonuclease VII small subunit [Bdellovibrionota bacterium]